jgi:hypothetical protein
LLLDDDTGAPAAPDHPIAQPSGINSLDSAEHAGKFATSPAAEAWAPDTVGACSGHADMRLSFARHREHDAGMHSGRQDTDHAAGALRFSHGQAAAARQEVGCTVSETLLRAGVLQQDSCKLIARDDYLGIQRSEDRVIIQITWNEGRSLEQKMALHRGIVAGLTASPGVRPEDVLLEVNEMNGSSGRGVAQYVP